MSRAPHRNKRKNEEMAEVKLRDYQRTILAGIAIKPRSLLELMHLTGLKRTQTQLLIAILNDAGELHGKRRGRIVDYCPGAGPKLNYRVETPRSDPRDFRWMPVPKKRHDGSDDPTHCVIRFGDHWPSHHGLGCNRPPLSGGSSIAGFF